MAVQKKTLSVHPRPHSIVYIQRDFTVHSPDNTAVQSPAVVVAPAGTVSAVVRTYLREVAKTCIASVAGAQGTPYCSRIPATHTDERVVIGMVAEVGTKTAVEGRTMREIELAVGAVRLGQRTVAGRTVRD